MQTIPKQTLIQAAQGDIQAFEQVYRATSGFVYSIALKITRNEADSQEITQDVFIKIHKNLRNFQFRSQFRTWVYRIAANTAINYYRKSVKDFNRRADFDVVIDTVAAPQTANNDLDKETNESLLDSLLKDLNPDQRAALLLREIEGLSYDEIARALNTNINTVRSRLKRARESIMAQNKEVIKNEL